MNGGKFPEVKGLGYAQVVGWFTYSPNGTSNPSVSACTGPAARWIDSITYSATGVQTIVFKAGFSFAQTPIFQPTPQPADLTGYFSVSQTGNYDTSTRTLVLQQHRAGTGEAVAAAAGAKVHVSILAQDTQGK